MTSIRCRPVRVLLFGAIAAVVGCGLAAEAMALDDERSLSYSAVVRQDRAQQQLLMQAREHLAGREILTALDEIQQVLDADSDSVVPSGGSLVGLKDQANQLLGALPLSQRETYERLYGGTARAALDIAQRAGDVSAIRTVALRYRHTQAGLEALRGLAARAFDAGRFATAARGFAMVLEHPLGQGPADHAAAAQRIVAWLRAGERQQAAQWLMRHQQRFDGRSVAVGGKTVDLAAWLGERLAETPPPSPVEIALPANEPVWQHETGLSPPLRELVDPLLSDLQRRGLPLLSPLRPVAAGGIAVARTMDEIWAVDVASGRARWRKPLDSFARKIGGSPERLLNSAFESMMATTLVHQRLADGRSAALATDGRRVYTLLPIETAESTDAGPARPPAAHVLAALDLTSGTELWRIGAGGTVAELDGLVFLGVPMHHDDALYVLGLDGARLELLALQPESGRPVWRLPLAEIGDPSGHSGRRGQRCPVVAEDGLLFCATGAGALVCVDPLLRSIRWAWRYPRRDVRFASENPHWVMGSPQPPWWDGWRDVALHVQRKFVVFAAPDADHLNVLDRETGRLLWQQPRRDGLYVAGVPPDRIGIVGAAGLRAVGLTDGRLLWQARTGRVAGRGVAAGDEYLLPLADGGMAAVAWRDGRVRRTFPAASEPLGNLIAVDGMIAAQSPDQLALCQPFAQARAAAERPTEESPDAPPALVAQARLAREAGEFAAAEALLDRALAREDRDETRTALRDTLLVALGQDRERTDHLAERLDALLDSPEARIGFLKTLAAAHRRAGRGVDALQSLFRLLDAGPSGDVIADEVPRRVVRVDRYVQGQILDLLASATAEERQQMETVIAQRLEQARDSSDPFARQRVVRQLDHVPQGMRAWTRDPQAASIGQTTVQTELQFREIVASSGSDRPLAAAALRQLAEQFVAHSHTRDAAAVYRRLRDQYADVRLDDGRTVDEIIAALDPNTELGEAVRRGPLDPWPSGPPTVTAQEKRTEPPRLAPLPVTAGPGTLFDRLTIGLDPERGRLRFQGDGVPGAWELAIPRSSSPFRVYPPMRRAWGVGSLLIVQYGGDLYGIAALSERGEPEARVLWHLDMIPESAANMDRMSILRTAAPRGFGLGRDYPVDNFEQTFAHVGPVGPGCVCYLFGGELIAVDPTTGHRLWRRNGLPPRCLSAGDAEFVLLYRTDAPEVEVLRTLDGRTMATHRLDVLPGDFLTSSGRHALHAAERPNGVSLRQIDLALGKTVWERTLAAGTIPFGLDEAACGVLEPEGMIHILRRDDGETLSNHRIDRPQTVEQIWCAADPRAWYVAVSEPTHGGDADAALIQGNFRRPAVRGTLCAFDRRTGRMLWTRPVAQGAFPLEQPRDVPLLVLRHTQSPPAGIVGESNDVIRCLDKRTGAGLATVTGPHGTLRFALDSALEQGRIDLITPTQTVRLEYAK